LKEIDQEIESTKKDKIEKIKDLEGKSKALLAAQK